MAQKMRDPLLLAGKIVVLLGQGFLALGAIVMVLAMPLVLIMQDRINAELQAEFANPELVFPTLAVVGVLALVLGIVAMAFLFLDHLRRIINTVGDGDPFLPINADRLTRMAWLTLAIQLVAIPAAGLALYIAKQLEEISTTIDAGFDLGGVILIITLFILARVFRHGAAMREDLEGTV